jgi:hypothetical protein
MTSGDMSIERHPVSSDIGLQEVSSQVCVTKHKGRPPSYRTAPSGCAWLFRALRMDANWVHRAFGRYTQFLSPQLNKIIDHRLPVGAPPIGRAANLRR